MTHSDLRIGNYVKLRDTGEIVRVCGLDCNFVMCGLKWGRCTKDYSEIEPVPIYDHWQKIDCGELLWVGGEEDDTKYWYCHANYPDRKFRYIHELQNLHHALTGEELKIEL